MAPSLSPYTMLSWVYQSMSKIVYWTPVTAKSTTLISLSSTKDRDDKTEQKTRVYLNLSTNHNNDDGRDDKSSDVWGFQDSCFQADSNGVVEVTGSRYFLSGHKLPDLLPWAKRTLGCHIPSKPLMDAFNDGSIIPEPHHINHEFIASIRKVLADDQIEADAVPRRRHGHGHTQEEMYNIKYGPGLARIPDLVVFPNDEAQVISVVTAARNHGVCLIPYGGGTNVTKALSCELDKENRMITSLDTSRLDKVLWVDSVNRMACIEAGAVGQNITDFLAVHGFTMGHEPDSCEFSTLGGWIATNASGMKRNKYGNIEDLVLDMRVITPSGKVLTKGGSEGGDINISPRQSTGSDPTHYFFGSEGTLGIIVSAVVKLFPLPEMQAYDAILFPSWETGVQFMYELRQEGEMPASVRLVDNEQFQMSMALKPASSGNTTVLAFKSTLEQLYLTRVHGFDLKEMVACTMVFEGSRTEVQRQQRSVKHLTRKFSGIQVGEDKGQRAYQMTYNIAYIRDFGMRHYILGESFETSVVWSGALDLCRRVKERIRHEHLVRRLPGTPLVTCRITQMYETGVAIYFYFAYYFENVVDPSSVYVDIEEAARDEILKCGGSLSHHHGVGKLRKKFVPRVMSDTSLIWKYEIKQTIDPENIFGCGNLIEIARE